MNITPRLLCLFIAAGLFVVATFYLPPGPPRFNVMAAGLFFVTLALLFS